MAAFDLVQVNSETHSDVYNSSSDDEITLEYVSGVSCKSKNAIAANPCNGNVAFVASSVMVLFDPRRTNQAFIENSSAREIGCVSFSDDGRFVAYGEIGHNPSVSVYNAKQFTQVNMFRVQEGKCSIKALQFHPKSIYIALLLAHDYGILVYEFVHGRKLAAAKWCVEPLAMTMTNTNCTLAVCGHRKISFFFLSDVESTRYETNAMLDKRAVILGKNGNYTFVDIVSGQNRSGRCLYTITSCGRLCDINAGVIKNVKKISNRCFTIKCAFGLLFIGCENGMVNVCNPKTMNVVACIDDNDLFGRDSRHPTNWSIKSDIVALAINETTSIVTTLMSNQQMHSWYIRFKDGGIECTSVQVSESEAENENRASKLLTNHDLNCTLAQLLVQLEMTNRRQKSQKTNFLQRQTESRFRQFNAIKITPDGKDIIFGNRSGEIKVYEATTGILKKVIEAHNADVTFVEVMFDNDFKLVATGGRDRVIFILNAKNDYRLVQAINDHASAIVSISLAHNNGILTLVSSAKDGVILIRRAHKEETPKFITIGELPDNLGSKTRSYNHSNGYIITGQEKGRINVFPFNQNANMKPTTKIQVGNANLKSVTIDPTSSFFVAFGTEGQYVFHLQTGQQIATLCYLPGFNHLSFSQDLTYFINSNDYGCKFVWRLPNKIINVMHANLKDRSCTMVTSREVIFNSYMSCVRVCRHMVGGEEEEGEEEGLMAPLGGNLNIEDFGKFSENEKNVISEKNLTFPLLRKQHRQMTISEKGHDFINFLCEDRHQLVESASYTSCCTTYSQSLTDVTHAIDDENEQVSKSKGGAGEEGGTGGGENDGSGDAGGRSSSADSDTVTLKVEPQSPKILPVDNVNLEAIITKLNTLHERSNFAHKTDPEQASNMCSTQTTDSSSIQSTTCQSIDVLRGIMTGHVADVEDGAETSDCLRTALIKNSSLDPNKGQLAGNMAALSRSLRRKVSLQTVHNKSGSTDAENESRLIFRKETEKVIASKETFPACTQQGVADGGQQDMPIGVPQGVQQGALNGVQHLTSRCVQHGSPQCAQQDVPQTVQQTEGSLRVESKAEEGKDSKTNDPTSHFKDSGVVEDQTDCTLNDTNLDDTVGKRSLLSSAIAKDSQHLTSKGGVLYMQHPDDVNEDTHASFTMHSPGMNPEEDPDSLKNNLETLHDLDDNGQLRDYYTEFCRNIHLSNYQETYVLKDSSDYDLLSSIPCCLENASRYECSGRNDSGKGSASYSYPLTTVEGSNNVSTETRLLGSMLQSRTVQSNDSYIEDFEIRQHDANLRKVFLSWLRRKLNKERMKMKQLKAQCHDQSLTQDRRPSETILEELSTTTDSMSPLEHYITTSSNVTWASNSSMCKEVRASHSNNDVVANAPSKTASEPIALATYDRSEVGLVQWQRYIHYGSKASVRCKNARYKSNASRIQGSPELSGRSSLVSGSNEGTNDYSTSSDSIGALLNGASSGVDGSTCSNSRGASRKSDKSCKSSSRNSSPKEKRLRSATEGSKRRAASLSKKMDLVGQKGHESPWSSPVVGNSGGMASLFRNQDDYLRKLKEVRRNFEKSIQELSNERKIQQIEAQRYFTDRK